MTSSNDENENDKKTQTSTISSSGNDHFNISTKTIGFYLLIIGITSAYLFKNYYSELVNIFLKSQSRGCLPLNSKFINNWPTYAIYGKKKSESHLKHVLETLEKFGYKRAQFEDDWDLLWAHDYPFRVFSERLINLEEHQLVNHFPGCGYITNKVDLATSNLPYIPKAFRLPEDKDEFLNYSNENPMKLFVEKHNEHRYIEIKRANEINFTSHTTFVQEFIANPYLVDGYKFDIGIYVIVTSINPLRVYIYKGDVLFRFCPTKYYPFDPKDLDKYIVGDDYLPIWKIPSLSHYYNKLKFGMKDSFDAYVEKNKQNPKLIWEQMEEQIREVLLLKESKIIDVLQRYKMKRNFFELMRFDFILDENLKVHLMEANMSPNLSSAHFKQNSLLYEQIIYSLMNLVGIASRIKGGRTGTSYSERFDSHDPMISSDKNIVVEGDVCSSPLCSNSCFNNLCKICIFCLNTETAEILHSAFREHIHKIDTKRIFPKPIKTLQDYNLDKELKKLSPENEFMTRWFYGKCKLDQTWCF